MAATPGQTSRPIPRLLHDVWSINNQTVIAVGDSGTILRSGDGGITWSLRESGGVRILLGVSFANGSLGFIVEIQAPYSGQRMAGLGWEKLVSGITETIVTPSLLLIRH